ncbi:MAG: DNA cytosine methyltransferase [Prevotellaceae bacterium]|jgi:DNA (cytosine-5)-methyltransferase 1|nr:DNA cytosine methyltransferase [Prevotellaceae bacterium]
MKEKNIKLLYIDLFCGAGGTSTGLESARHNGRKCAKVIACVNHDANAIASHAANHPDALHFTEDIRTLELSPLVSHIEKMKATYPEALVVLWSSLECTNFSKAKGGQPRDADSRTLAEHLFRYVEAITPDYIQIENVEEFMCWGDLDENGKPVSRDKGRKYLQWVERVKHYGYTFKHRILNAADYGAYTSRKRFFGIFAKSGLPIVFPKPTHAKNGSKDLFDNLKKWKAVKEVLDFSDEGKSVFTRKQTLSKRTFERIYAGLVKFVAGGKAAFLAKYNSSDQHGNVSPNSCTSVDKPAHTIATQPRMCLVQLSFLMSSYSNGHNCTSIDNPCTTIVNNPKQNIVSCKRPCLVAAESGVAIEVYETDSEPMRQIKEFMALYGIADIKMRMLKIPELKRIMGFPEDYTLIGTQAEHKKFIGNAVEVNMARVMCEALAGAATAKKLAAAA